jgi:hypothetical protein
MNCWACAAQSLEAYFRGAFEPAAELFEHAKRFRPSDIGAGTMRDRSYMLASNPPKEWNGVHIMHEK